MPPDLKPLKGYCNKIPGHRDGTRAHVSTLIRHATSGVRAPDGQRVKLRAIRFGNHWLTTDIWFSEFIDSLSTGMPTSAEPRTPTTRRRECEAAEAELIARGG